MVKNSIEARDAQLKLTEAESKGEEVQQAKLDSLSQEELVRLRYNYVMSKTKKIRKVTSPERTLKRQTPVVFLQNQ